jgi:hypothetical protein
MSKRTPTILDAKRIRTPKPKAGPKDRFRGTGTPATPRTAETFPQMRRRGRS